MIRPLWLINSTLFISLFFALLFVLFSVQKIPKRMSLDVGLPEKQTLLALKSIDVASIYENDLFNTYHKVYEQVVQPTYTVPMPPLPEQVMARVPAEVKQVFLPPLDLKLRGVAVVTDGTNNLAIIAESQTNEQKLYKVDDIIHDARLIKIFPNRVILLRSNGQQEVLYLNQKEIEEYTFIKEEKSKWIHVVKKINATHYECDPEVFSRILPTVAQCIDIFDLTTTYKEGICTGCSIGNLTTESLPKALGFESLDLIESVEDIATVDLESRMRIYAACKDKKYGETIKVKLLRNGQNYLYTYKMVDLKDELEESLEAVKKEELLPGSHQGPTAQEIEEEHIRLLAAKHKFAPTLQELKIQQKMAMLKEDSYKTAN